MIIIKFIKIHRKLNTQISD